MARSVLLDVQKTSTQRRTTPSAAVAIVGASTRNPQKSVMYQTKWPQAGLPIDVVTRSRTAPAVKPAATQPLDIDWPRFKNSTESMLGRARPKKQAGIQTAAWSRTTCRYQRFQRGNTSWVTRNTVPTCDNWMFCP